jgi:hypothetical protein
MPTCEAIIRSLVGKAVQGDTRSLTAVMEIIEMTGRTDDITDEQREKIAMHLPASFTMEECDLLESEAREKDRERCRYLAESAPERFAIADDGKPINLIVPAAIKFGDQLAAQRKFAEALTAYRDELARCRTAPHRR